jgi:hypothetical protein
MMESVLSLFVASLMILVFASLFTVRTVNQRNIYKTQAAAIAQEELSALKRFDIISLADQSNGPFLGMVYNAGTWNVINDGTAGHSLPNSLDLPGATGYANRYSGLLQFPAGSYADATFQTKLNFRSDTASGTAAGLLLRASDAKNGYRFLVAPSGTDLDTTLAGQQNWIVERVQNGTAVTPRLLSLSVAGITTNAWHTIKVVLNATSIKTYLNGNEQDDGTLIDAAYTDGVSALLAWNGAHVGFDDTSTTVGTTTDSWDFDSSTSMPIDWIRLGLNDVPDATSSVFDDNGKLTLTAYPNTNSSTLKQATITITWKQLAGGAGTYSISSLIGASRIGQ